MPKPRLIRLAAVPLGTVLTLLTVAAAQPTQPPGKDPTPLTPKKVLSQLKRALVEVPGKAPVELPKIPPPDPRAALLPQGFVAEVVLADLTYPSSVEFDDAGTLYVAEAGFNYGDDAAPARVWRVGADGTRQ